MLLHGESYSDSQLLQMVNTWSVELWDDCEKLVEKT
jgi:hypothetical protein